MNRIYQKQELVGIGEKLYFNKNGRHFGKSQYSQIRFLYAAATVIRKSGLHTAKHFRGSSSSGGRTGEIDFGLLLNYAGSRVFVIFLVFSFPFCLTREQPIGESTHD